MALQGSILAAGLTVGLTLAAAAVTPLSAADLYGNTRDERASPYEDPRYAEIFGYDRRERGPRDYRERRRYEDRDDEDYRTRPIARQPARPHYDEGYDPERYRTAGCVPRRVIRRRLLSAGWHAFNRVVFKGDIVRFYASDARGARHIVFLNRCSGRIIDSLRLERDRFARSRRRDFDPRY